MRPARACRARLFSPFTLALGLSLVAGRPALPQTIPSSARATLFQPLSLSAGVLAPGVAVPGIGHYAGALALSASVAGTASPGPFPHGPGQQCRAAIRAAERAEKIPDQLMAAIARVESGRREPDGTVDPWPWSINAEGESYIYDSKAEAVAAVRALRNSGMRSIDVGCMQVNLMHHPDAFASLDEAFDPVANANYAARFLRQLHEQTGAWPTATAWYHSATPQLGAEYQRKVMAALPAERQQEDQAPATEPRVPGGIGGGGGGGGFAGGFRGGFPGGLARGIVGVGARPAAGVAASSQAVPARIIPMSAGASVGAPAGVTGRGLSAYRAAPITIVAPAPSIPAALAVLPARAAARAPVIVPGAPQEADGPLTAR